MNNEYKCTMCGKTLDYFDEQENFGFAYKVGYGSKYDLCHVRAKLCCSCFDKVLDYIKDNSINSPIVAEYE